VVAELEEVAKERDEAKTTVDKHLGQIQRLEEDFETTKAKVMNFAAIYLNL